MKKWQCTVCNYTHTGDQLPESCPVCGVYRDSFKLLEGDEEEGDPESEDPTGAALEKNKQQKCSVCGYIRRDGDPKDACPVCGVAADSFRDITASSTPAQKRNAEPSGDTPESDAVEKKWKCTVCGYIHTGPEPPDKCPVCGADRSLFILQEPDESPAEKKPAGPVVGKTTPDDIPPAGGPAPVDAGLTSEPSQISGIYTTITTQMSKLHGHPITVHIPNGVLPVAFLFFLMGILFGSDTLLQVSHYNLVFVLISMPLVLFSGYNDWQIRLGGAMTKVIKTKMICGAIVTALSLILVLWRWINPHVVEQWSSGRFIFLGLFAVALGAAALAGFYGGKLIRFPGDDKF